MLKGTSGSINCLQKRRDDLSCEDVASGPSLAMARRSRGSGRPAEEEQGRLPLGPIAGSCLTLQARQLISVIDY